MYVFRLMHQLGHYLEILKLVATLFNFTTLEFQNSIILLVLINIFDGEL